MKLEILKKLIALANNNPNDNEANLAARKVCKALVEDDYVAQLSEMGPPIPPKATKTTKSWDPYEDLADLMNRAKQEQARQRKTYEPRQTASSIYEEYFRHTRSGQWEKGFNTGNKKKKKDRELKCKKCGNIVKTIFVGPPEVFECNNCVWNAYNKERETEKKKASPVICHLTGKPCGTPITCVGNGCSWKI